MREVLLIKNEHSIAVNLALGGELGTHVRCWADKEQIWLAVVETERHVLLTIIVVVVARIEGFVHPRQSFGK